MRSFSIAASSFLFFACSNPSSGYLDDWGSEDITAGKSDGLADLATEIRLDEEVSGAVTSESIVLYKIGLLKGDELLGTMNVESGDLAPHFTIFFGVRKKIDSTSFEVSDGKLIKTYKIAESGTHFVALRAFQNQGAGAFRFTLACADGACAGDPQGPVLADHDADECISRAKDCAFERMGVFNGAVGPARARSLFEECLGEIETDDGLSCGLACLSESDGDSDGDPGEVCDAVISQIPFFADASSECLGQLEECMSVCQSLHEGGFGHASSEEIFEERFSRCWLYGFNGHCPGYAQKTADCGGPIDGGEPECEEFCAATDGAWADDLSSACPSDVCSDL